MSARVSALDIEAPEDLFINLDGEPIAGRHFHVEALPQALRLHLPEGCVLL